MSIVKMFYFVGDWVSNRFHRNVPWRRRPAVKMYHLQRTWNYLQCSEYGMDLLRRLDWPKYSIKMKNESILQIDVFYMLQRSMSEPKNIFLFFFIKDRSRYKKILSHLQKTRYSFMRSLLGRVNSQREEVFYLSITLGYTAIAWLYSLYL